MPYCSWIIPWFKSEVALAVEMYTTYKRRFFWETSGACLVFCGLGFWVKHGKNGALICKARVEATNLVLASASGRVTVITGRHTAVLTLACTITLRLSRFVALTMSFKHIQQPANFLPPPFAHPDAVRWDAAGWQHGNHAKVCQWNSVFTFTWTSLMVLKNRKKSKVAGTAGYVSLEFVALKSA